MNSKEADSVGLVECVVPGCQESLIEHSGPVHCAGHTPDPSALIVGQHVETGKEGTTSYDYGRVLAVRGARITVAWRYAGTDTEHERHELRRGLTPYALLSSENGNHRPTAPGGEERGPVSTWATP